MPLMAAEQTRASMVDLCGKSRLTASACFAKAYELKGGRVKEAEAFNRQDCGNRVPIFGFVLGSPGHYLGSNAF